MIGVVRPGNSTITQLPEAYSYNAGTYAMAGAAGPRYTINYNSCGGSRSCQSDGDSVLFSYSGSALVQVQDFGVVNFTPQDSLSPQLLQPGVAIGVQAWHTEQFAGDRGVPNGSTGGVTNVTDNFGHSRAWTYDGFGRITETQEWPSAAGALVTTAVWDAQNNLTWSTDVGANQTNYTYDVNGNTLSVQQPTVQTSLGRGSPTSVFTYDAYNNLVTYSIPTTCGSTAPRAAPRLRVPRTTSTLQLQRSHSVR